MRIDLPIIVVPNPELLDDHQTELAVEVERQGYCVHGRLESVVNIVWRTNFANIEVVIFQEPSRLRKLKQEKGGPRTIARWTLLVGVSLVFWMKKWDGQRENRIRFNGWTNNSVYGVFWGGILVRIRPGVHGR